MTIERTDLSNEEYRSKTSKQTGGTKDSFVARLAKRMAEDPEGCECAVCVRNWEELG
jgi:hypothetical protein